MDSAYGEDCQPRYYSVLELQRTRVIWKNCLILSFTLWVYSFQSDFSWHFCWISVVRDCSSGRKVCSSDTDKGMMSLSRLSRSFIGTGIQYCFTRNLHSYSTNFYFTYFLRVTTGGLACIFICLSVNRFGRRGILLLSAIITGLSSLLLLALTQCMSHPHLAHQPLAFSLVVSGNDYWPKQAFTALFRAQNKTLMLGSAVLTLCLIDVSDKHFECLCHQPHSQQREI